MSEIEDLAARQLEAYNASDLDAFVAQGSLRASILAFVGLVLGWFGPRRFS